MKSVPEAHSEQGEQGEARHKDQERKAIVCQKAKKYIEKATKRKTMLNNKDEELGKDWNNLNNEYELLEQKLEDAKEGKDIDATDIVEIDNW